MNETTALYRLWDSQERLLYVGISNHWMRRLFEHAKGKGWSDEVVKVTTESFNSREEALEAESVAIRMEGPIHNRKGNPRFSSPMGPTATEWDHISALWGLVGGLIGVTCALANKFPEEEIVSSSLRTLRAMDDLLEGLS
jgi:predicted GIY-YIG superfamily endonuclease